MSNLSNLLIEISHCSEVHAAKENKNHPCHRIVSTQNGMLFQLPEPWNGDLEIASVLFISSNPSIDLSEEYPDESWKDDKICEFHKTRLNNEHYKKNVRYWTYIKKYASWLFDTTPDDETLSNKICITEIVHCKSTKERGVRQCRFYCTEKWMHEILSQFHGPYVVLLGSHTRFLNNWMHEKGFNAFWMPHPYSSKWTDEERKRRMTFWKEILQKLHR